MYDNTTAAVPIMAGISLGVKAVAPASIEYGFGFGTGLTIVTDDVCDLTIVLE